MDEPDEVQKPAKLTAAGVKKAEKMEKSFGKAVGGKLKLKGVDFKAGGKKVKKSKDGSQKLDLEAKTREAELDSRVKKKSDRFCMHT